MSTSHTLLKLARQLHLYIGVFIAPAVLFFAVTGGLQVFSLHETTRGSDYQPPAWLAVAAQLHKKQTSVMPAHKARPSDAASAAPTLHAPAPMSAKPNAPLRHPLPLKIFSAFVSLGLFISTLLGLYMAYRYTRKHVLISLLLTAGTLLPIVLSFV